MGLGDDLMFLGEAEQIHQNTGKKITPIYGTGWSCLFDNVEFLSREKNKESIYVNARDHAGPCDVHVDYYVKDNHKESLTFRNYSPKPFYIRYTDEELEFADSQLKKYGLNKKQFVAINPDYKSKFFGQNKNWGFEKYQELTNLISKDITVVRIHPGGDYQEPDLKNAINIPSHGLRKSFCFLRHSKIGITYEGFFAHVFGGMRIPCITLFGGLTPKSSLHYNTGISIEYPHHKSPCGSKKNCSHCKEANEWMTVDKIYEAYKYKLTRTDESS